MPAAITIQTATAFDSNTSPKTFPDLNWSEGDVVVIMIIGDTGNQGGFNFAVTPDNANLSFGAPTTFGIGSGTEEGLQIYTTTALTAETGQTITCTRDNGWPGNWGAKLWIVTEAAAITNVIANGTEGTISRTVSAGSVGLYGMGDFTADSTDHTIATGSGVAQEREDGQSVGSHSWFFGDWTNMGAGTFGFGVTDYTGHIVSHGFVEVTARPTAPYVVASANAAITASRSPSLTFATPAVENDVVIMWPSTSTTAVAITTPAVWENPLGGNTDVESDAHSICCVAHRVTAGEAGTTTFTATNLYDAVQTGNVVGMLIRNVNRQNMFGGAGSTFSSTNTVTPHVLATVTAGNVVVTEGLVVSGVAKDGTGTYTTPGGWTVGSTSNSTQGKWCGSRTALTVAGTAVAATNITPSAGDEYASITVVLSRQLDPTEMRQTLVRQAVNQSAVW